MAKQLFAVTMGDETAVFEEELPIPAHTFTGKCCRKTTSNLAVALLVGVKVFIVSGNGTYSIGFFGEPVTMPLYHALSMEEMANRIAA